MCGGSWSFRLCGGLPRDVAIFGDRLPVLSCIAHLCEGIRAGRQTGRRCAAVKKKHISSSTISTRKFIILLWKTWNSQKLEGTRIAYGVRYAMPVAKRAQEIQLSRRQRYLHKSNNAMRVGGKQFHATSKFTRRFMSMKSKLMNHKDAAFKRAGKGVMKTTLLHKPIPIPQAMKIPDAKAAVVWDTLKNLPAWRMVIEQQAQKTERRSILQRLLTVVILRIRSLEKAVPQI